MNRTLPLGIMQGRLLPPINGRIQCFPRDQWREEFPLAQAAGLDLIEWIYEVYGADQNPLSRNDGIKELKELSAKHGISVRSLCADYFMDRPLLVQPEAGVQKLLWLLERCDNAGIKRIILPFVDASRLANAEAELAIVNLLMRVAREAEFLDIELHLETDLPAERFAALMAQLPGRVFKVNYDSGNSASHGYKVTEEFRAYGDRIGSLHVKDRVLGGGTVPLGMGNADFALLRSSLEEINYDDDVILQVARGMEGNELEWIRSVRATVEGALFSFEIAGIHSR